MNKHLFLKYFPSFLILIGVLLWLNSLFFSTVTNKHEAKLNNYWLGNLKRSSTLLDSINHGLLVGMEIVVRADDEPIFNVGNKIVGFQQKIITDLDEKSEQSDTSIYQIIADFNHNLADALVNLAQRNQLVTEKEVQNILEQTQFRQNSPFNDLKDNIMFQKNLIYKNTSLSLNFLATKVGGGCGCWFDYYEPILNFKEPLKIGKNANAKIYLLHRPCDKPYKTLHRKWRINNKSVNDVSGGAAKLSRVFKDNLPKTFNVEYEVHVKYFRTFDSTIDTIRLNQQFIIHPIFK